MVVPVDTAEGRGSFILFEANALVQCGRIRNLVQLLQFDHSAECLHCIDEIVLLRVV